MPTVDKVTIPDGAGAVYAGNSADPRNMIKAAIDAADHVQELYNSIDSAAILRGIRVNVLSFTSVSIEDGQLHKLGDYYSTVDLAKSDFPACPIDIVASLVGGWSEISVAWCAFWEAAYSNSKSIYVPNGRYVLNAPIILREHAQEWECTISSRWYHDDVFPIDCPCIVEFVGDGTAFKRVMTRRKYRANINDPQDDAISACVQIENNQIKWQPAVFIRHDPDNAPQNTPTSTFIDNDANWDVGIFVSRWGVNLTNAASVGHFRVANLYADCTRNAFVLPELVGWDNVAHPITKNSGIDGLQLDNTSFSGGRWSYLCLGAEPKAGLNTYGKDLTAYIGVSFVSNPTSSATLTLGGVTFNYSLADNPTDLLSIVIGTTLEETFNNTMIKINDIKNNTDFTESVFNLGAFVLKSAGYGFDIVSDVVPSSDFSDVFTASTNSAAISISASSGGIPLVGTDPAPYYDQQLGTTVPDGRGSAGASDVSAYRMIAGQSIWAAGRRAFADNRPDLNYLLEGLSAGAMWIDGLAGNSRRRIWGHRYFSCRIQNFAPFIVRLGRCARLDFYGCHTEPTAKPISKDGLSVGGRYGSYTNTIHSNAINIYGANAAPNGNYFALRDPSSNFIAPQSGKNIFGGSVAINKSLQVGNALPDGEPPFINVYGGTAQAVNFKNSTGLPDARVVHRYSDGSVSIELARHLNAGTMIRGIRFKYSGGAMEWNCQTGLAINSSGNFISLRTSTGNVIVGADDAAGVVQLRSSNVTRATVSNDAFTLSKNLAASSSNAIDLGTTSSRFNVLHANNAVFNPSVISPTLANNQLKFATPSPVLVEVVFKGSDGVERVFGLHQKGVGSPEGVVTAPVGTIYTRTDGGIGSTMYVKESGTGNTGWSAK